MQILSSVRLAVSLVLDRSAAAEFYDGARNQPNKIWREPQATELYSNFNHYNIATCLFDICTNA